jgi:hypothetical protein
MLMKNRKGEEAAPNENQAKESTFYTYILPRRGGSR